MTMPIHEALGRVVVAYDEVSNADRAIHARGVSRFDSALVGPPGRLHGGYHVIVRTLSILDRVSAHDSTRTFPCEVDVTMLRAIALEQSVPFEAIYTADDRGWSLTTRFDGTDRLCARVRSSTDATLADATDFGRWRELFERAAPSEEAFKMFGVSIRVAPDLIWVEAHEPPTEPGQHASLLDADGSFGPAFIATQLDSVGAVARGAIMRHPHFTKHIALRFGVGSIAPGTRLLCVADRTAMVEDETSDTAPVDIGGRLYGTVRVPVALVDAGFTTAYATGAITVHPVDPAKFAPLQKMRTLREDLPR